MKWMIKLQSSTDWPTLHDQSCFTHFCQCVIIQTSPIYSSRIADSQSSSIRSVHSTVTITSPLLFASPCSPAARPLSYAHTVIIYSNTPQEILFLSGFFFSKCTLPVALQTMRRSTFNIFAIQNKACVEYRGVVRGIPVWLINIDGPLLTSGLLLDVCLCANFYLITYSMCIYLFSQNCFAAWLCTHITKIHLHMHRAEANIWR